MNGNSEQAGVTGMKKRNEPDSESEEGNKEAGTDTDAEVVAVDDDDSDSSADFEREDDSEEEEEEVVDSGDTIVEPKRKSTNNGKCSKLWRPY